MEGNVSKSGFEMVRCDICEKGTNPGYTRPVKLRRGRISVDLTACTDCALYAVRNELGSLRAELSS